MPRFTVPVLAALLAACSAAEEAGPRELDQRATPAEVVHKVREAAALLTREGPRGLDVLRDPRSRFTWKDTYVFAVDCAADRVLANPRFPERQGGDILRHTDYAGKRYGPELREVARRPGGGWIEYVWLRPGTGEPERKVSFVLNVPGRPYTVGAGVYDAELTLAELEALARRQTPTGRPARSPR